MEGSKGLTTQDNKNPKTLKISPLPLSFFVSTSHPNKPKATKLTKSDLERAYQIYLDRDQPLVRLLAKAFGLTCNTYALPAPYSPHQRPHLLTPKSPIRHLIVAKRKRKSSGFEREIKWATLVA